MAEETATRIIEFCENCKEESKFGVKATAQDSKGRPCCENCRLLEPMPVGPPAPQPSALVLAESASDEVKSVHLVARSPQEMAAAQDDLSAWLTAKAKSGKAEIKELQTALDTAVRNKWASKTFATQLSRAKQRHVFYSKTLDAVNAGYCIIPNFPIDVFAVRVSRERPKYQTAYTDNAWGNADHKLNDESPQLLPAGEGRYVSQSQKVARWEVPTKDDKGNAVVRKFSATSEFGEIAFPIIAAQASVMNATAQAMALKIFDQIGICPQSRPKGDPLIIGQILLPKVGYQDHKTVSFIIAWHLDLRTL